MEPPTRVMPQGVVWEPDVWESVPKQHLALPNTSCVLTKATPSSSIRMTMGSSAMRIARARGILTAKPLSAVS